MHQRIKTVGQLLAHFKLCRLPVQTTMFLNSQSQGFFGQDVPIHHGMVKDKRFANDYTSILSFYSLRKARRVLAITSSLYMYFHNLKPKDFFNYMDVLTFVESIVYLIDRDSEGSDASEKFKFDFSNLYEISEKEFSSSTNTNRYISVLCEFLKNHNFYDDHINRLIHEGLLYNKLEQWCMRCISNKNLLSELNEHVVQKTNSFRACDIRIQNLLLYQLTNRPYNEEDINFLRNHEIICDTLDDLYSYEKDVLGNKFNMYRMYTKLYPDNDLCKANFTKYILSCRPGNLTIYDYLKLKYPHCGIQPDESEMLIPTFQETKSGDIVLSDIWVFPEPINDEEEFRKKHHSQARQTKT